MHGYQTQSNTDRGVCLDHNMYPSRVDRWMRNQFHLGSYGTPASVTLDASSVSVTEFTASGGTSNYTWSLSDDSLGTLYTADATALYQNTTNIGTNTLTLTDDGGSSVYATIRQR